MIWPCDPPKAHEVKVTVDQSGKSSGFSKVQISGLEAKIQEAFC